MIYVALAYEFGLSNETEKALKTLKDGEDRFNEIAQENEDSRNLIPAFSHVLKATEVFLLKQNGNIDRASEVMSSG